MTILIQGMNYPPEMIGVGKYTGQLAAFLKSQGHAVEVITALPHYPGFFARRSQNWCYERAVEQGIAVTRCPLILRNGARGIWRLVAPLSFAVAAAPVLLWRTFRLRPDLVLCVEPTLLAAPVALAAARLCGARTVLHVQDLEVDAAFATAHLRGRWVRRLAEAVERRLLRRFDAVVTISDAMAARLGRKGVAADRLSVVRNWVDRAATRPAGAPGFYRERLGLATTDRVILYAGNLGAKQGIPTLLAALRLMPDDPGLRVVIAGEGPMAAAVAATRAVLPGLLVLPLQPAEHLGDLLAMADVHVLPQDRCAADLVFPSKLGPVLATGRPAVVTADPGTELACWLGAAAILVPPGDPAGLATALAAAAGGTARPDPIRARALVDSLDARQVLPAFEATLLRLLDRGARPARTTVAGPGWSGVEPAWSLADPADGIASLPG